MYSIFGVLANYFDVYSIPCLFIIATLLYQSFDLPVSY